METGELFDSGAVDLPLSRIEVHLKPGVMDPVAASTEVALRDLGLKVRQVRTGRAFVVSDRIESVGSCETIASRMLANGVIESVHFEPYLPTEFETGREYQFKLKHVSLLNLDDEQLTKLEPRGASVSVAGGDEGDSGLFPGAEREPTDVELETLAQTWSEHCVHKTLKSAVDVEVRDATGKVIGERRYENLIKETIFQQHDGADGEAERRSRFCLSVFADNAGVIAFDETDAVCFKVETHNHPSAIEPYGGSATGIGGVIRDILGTGLGGQADREYGCVLRGVSRMTTVSDRTLPRRVSFIPSASLQQVVAGVRDYGNRMGIPTVNGAVYFDDRYLGNPLVFCGCVGLIPRDKIAKAARTGRCDRRHGRAHRAGWHSRGDVLISGVDRYACG